MSGENKSEGGIPEGVMSYTRGQLRNGIVETVYVWASVTIHATTRETKVDTIVFVGKPELRLAGRGGRVLSARAFISRVT